MSKPKVDPASRKVLAYSVETNDPEESSIQFATSNAAARRQGADEIGTDFGAVSCRRAHWADQYAGQRFVPAKAYIDAGWWFGCNHCGARCDSDPAIGMKKPKPISRWTWCSMVAWSTALRSACPDMKPRSRPAMQDSKSSRFGLRQHGLASPSPSSPADTRGAATKGCSPSPEPNTADQ